MIGSRDYPTTADVEEAFRLLHKFATDRHGIVMVMEGRVFVMLPGDGVRP